MKNARVGTKAMKRSWTWGALAIVLAGTAWGCGSSSADGEEAVKDEAFARVINVEVQPVTPRKFVEEIRLTGSVTASHDVEVAAEESGVIREVLVDKGSHVRTGQALIKIDDQVLRAQVAQARAQADLAKQTWDRRKRLWEEDSVGSEMAYLQAKFAAQQTQANLEGLEARLERTTVRAPFDGVLDERRVEVGSMVSPGQVVGRVVALDPVKVQAGVPERYAAFVHTGAQAEITFDVLADRVFHAPVHYVGSTVNPQNRTFAVEAELRNPDELVKPEMVANLSLAQRVLDSAIVVPQDALVRVEGGYVAFVAGRDPRGRIAQVRKLTLGPSQRNLVVVTSGIQAGDSVIVVGQKSVADGDRINVVGTRD